MDHENYLDYDFILELEKNNANLIMKIKEQDIEAFRLLEKTKMNVLYLTLKKNYELSDKLVRQYKNVLIKAYSFIFSETNK